MNKGGEPFEAMRHSQNILLGTVIGVGAVVVAVGAILVALQIYTLQKIDAVQARLDIKIDALQITTQQKFDNIPAQIDRVVSTLAQSITAARSAPIQVLLVPAPTPSAEPKKP
jgi:hypothetical protein